MKLHSQHITKSSTTSVSKSNNDDDDDDNDDDGVLYVEHIISNRWSHSVLKRLIRQTISSDSKQTKAASSLSSSSLSSVSSSSSSSKRSSHELSGIPMYDDFFNAVCHGFGIFLRNSVSSSSSSSVSSSSSSSTTSKKKKITKKTMHSSSISKRENEIDVVSVVVNKNSTLREWAKTGWGAFIIISLFEVLDLMCKRKHQSTNPPSTSSSSSSSSLSSLSPSSARAFIHSIVCHLKPIRKKLRSLKGLYTGCGILVNKINAYSRMWK